MATVADHGDGDRRIGNVVMLAKNCMLKIQELLDFQEVHRCTDDCPTGCAKMDIFGYKYSSVADLVYDVVRDPQVQNAGATYQVKRGKFTFIRENKKTGEKFYKFEYVLEVDSEIPEMEPIHLEIMAQMNGVVGFHSESLFRRDRTEVQKATQAKLEGFMDTFCRLVKNGLQYKKVTTAIQDEILNVFGAHVVFRPTVGWCLDEAGKRLSDGEKTITTNVKSSTTLFEKGQRYLVDIGITFPDPTTGAKIDKNHFHVTRTVRILSNGAKNILDSFNSTPATTPSTVASQIDRMTLSVDSGAGSCSEPETPASVLRAKGRAKAVPSTSAVTPSKPKSTKRDKNSPVVKLPKVRRQLQLAEAVEVAAVKQEVEVPPPERKPKARRTKPKVDDEDDDSE